MKKLVLSFMSLVIALSAATPVFAEVTTMPANFTPPQRPGVEKTRTGTPGAMQEQKMQDKMEATAGNLQARAEKEVARRVESLQKLLIRISEFKKLSAKQKASLTTQVQAQITALNALLVKIQADTDETVLKTDVQSIVSNYRIYALFMPQIQMLGAADRMLTIADEMTTQATRLETTIADAKTKGKDVTEQEALLADMKAKIVDAQTNAQSVIDTVSPLTPDGYPDNKTTLQSSRQLLETAMQDLITARQDARKIISGSLVLGIDFKPSPDTTTMKPKTQVLKPTKAIIPTVAPTATQNPL